MMPSSAASTAATRRGTPTRPATAPLVESDKIFADVENLRGGEGPDILAGGAMQNVLEGAGGDDAVAGEERKTGTAVGLGTTPSPAMAATNSSPPSATPHVADVIDRSSGKDAVEYAMRNEALSPTLAGGADAARAARATTCAASRRRPLGRAPTR